MSKRTKEQMQDQILGGFNRVLRADKNAQIYGKDNLSALETELAASKKRTRKFDDGELKVQRFIPTAAGAYGDNYANINGVLTKKS
jgi:hypothetical protein